VGGSQFLLPIGEAIVGELVLFTVA